VWERCERCSESEEKQKDRKRLNDCKRLYAVFRERERERERVRIYILSIKQLTKKMTCIRWGVDCCNVDWLRRRWRRRGVW
jgi:hypothetical protein